ncbi:MAG: gliding motility-associated C-terminal domain-containing protein [Flavobacteriales bacterium]|nr:gliding motility-associated C-terminal domain-containing protein [Flavobacteriales bacterium]
MKRIVLLALAAFSIITVNAQRGKDGAKTVTGPAEEVNAFTMLTSDATIGDTLINVTSSTLSTNFSSNLAAGDLIMIYQVQGASIEDSITVPSFPNSSKFHHTWGRITNYNNAGNYEFVQVKSVPNGTSIVFDCALKRNYTASGRVMVVRVPRYLSLTVNGGGVLTTSQWNGSSGGLLAVEVLGVTTINAGGLIDVSEKGFRGGVVDINSTNGGLRYADNNPVEGAEKGEGIAGDQAFYSSNLSGRYCRGAAANGGGGGNAHNSGGGGGANAGDVALWNKGIGNPDVSSANFIQAWTLDTNLMAVNSNPALIVSSGGGRGGYSHCSSNRNELTVPPNNSTWGGDLRRDNGGLGGRPLDYSTNKIFMGGAGGAGDANDVWGGDGGNGAGIVFIKSYGAINGAGSITANGEAGGNSSGPASPGFGQYSGKEGAGGGGAGGTVILQTTSNVSGITISANGGKGGDQIMTTGSAAVIQEAEGPGGSGGGGYVAVYSGSPTISVIAGVNGTTNSPLISNFNPNGATRGGVGISNGTITSFDLTANDQNICANNTATLTATFSGTTPVGATIEWYDAEFGGNLLQTGPSFTTPTLSTQTTYYVKSCPGTFTIPVTVFINACGTPPVTSFGSSDSSFCIGSCINFSDLSTGTPSSWTWYFFGSDSLTSNLQNPTNICYNTAGTFDVALVATNPSGSDSLFIPNFITVNALPTITTSPDTAICIGDAVNLSATGGTSYLWDNGLGNGATQSPSPITNTTYTVYVTDANLCLDSAQVDVTINSLPTIIASVDTTICTGDAANLSATGGNTYFWDNGLGSGASHSPSPIVSTTYHVIGTDVNMCTNTDSVRVTVGACGLAPVASFSSSDSTICVGSCISFTDLSINLPTSWMWYFFGSDSLTSTQQNPTNICYNTAGSFDVALVSTNSTGSDSLFIPNFITVFSLPTITTSPDTAICSGSNVNLSASGANTYSWNNGLGSGATHSPSPTINTTYTVTGTDLNNCVNTAQVIVTINALPVLTTSPDTSVCVGDTIKLRASGANSYSWNNGIGNVQNPNVIASSISSYTVTGTDVNGCVNTSLVQVTINALPIIIASNDVTICNGDTTTLSASGGVFYSWDNGLGLGQTKSVFPSITTTYTVTGSNSNFCRNTDQVIVTVNNCVTPVANFTVSNTNLCINNCVNFTDLSTSSPNSWSWYFFGADSLTSNQQNPTNICYSNVGSFNVALVVSNSNGTDSIHFANYIVVDSCNTPTPTIVVEPVVVIPNVFSPNIDGQNDLFKVTGIGIKTVAMKIYNRWGQVVFESIQANDGWDGRTNSGVKVPEGTYFYIIDVETDKKETFTGTLTLIR